MTKATHNGTCQACGRSQAYTANGVAKHGYTTKWGYFTGTCSGSDKAPLELATEHNVATVAAIRDWADKQDEKAAGEILKITVSRRRQQRERYESLYEEVEMTRDDWMQAHAKKIEEFADENTDAAYWSKYYSDKFDDKVDDVRNMLKRNATHARKDADLLDALRDKTFGNELEAREAETTLHREDFTTKGPRAAYGRQAELKEQGIKATVRRNKYNEITLTYRK